MESKHKGRRAAIDELLVYLLPLLEAKEGNWLSRNPILNVYSYESGISIRILREYVDVLAAAGKIGYGGFGYDPKIRLVGAS